MTIETSSPNRLEHIQALRGIAALMVMISHLYWIDQKYNAAPILPESALFGMAGVDMFFVISGFIMVYITNKWTQPSITRIPEFIFARLTRIYPLYWVVSGALLSVYFLRPDLVFSQSPGEPNIAKSFFLLPDKNLPLLEVGWTLIHELGFYIVFAGLLIFSKPIRLWALFIWAAIIIAAVVFDVNEQSSFAYYALSPLTLEFIAGCLLGWLFTKNLFGKIAWILPITIISLLGGIWAYQAFGGQTIFNDHSKRTLIFTIPTSLVVLLAVLRDQRNRTCPKVLVTLGDWSYALYLTHVLTLSVIGRLWALLEIENPFASVFALIVMSIAAIAVAGVTYKLVERPALLLGKKFRQQIFS